MACGARMRQCREGNKDYPPRAGVDFKGSWPFSGVASMPGARARDPNRAKVGKFDLQAFHLEAQHAAAGEHQRHLSGRGIGLGEVSFDNRFQAGWKPRSRTLPVPGTTLQSY